MVLDRKPRGNRRYVLAAVGLLIAFAVGAGTERAGVWINSPDGYPAYQDRAENQQSAKPKSTYAKSVEPIKKIKPCAPEGGRDESELCASWQAADAAHKSALWAWYQMVLSLFGVAGLGVTLWLTRGTILETRRIGEAQTRCYVSVISVTLRISEDMIPLISVRVKNTGQSPALDLVVFYSTRFGILSTPKGAQEYGPEISSDPLSVVAGAEVPFPPIAYVSGFDKEIVDAIVAREKYVTMDIALRFEGRDVFDRPIKGGGAFNHVSSAWEIKTTYEFSSADEVIANLRNELVRRERKRDGDKGV